MKAALIKKLYPFENPTSFESHASISRGFDTSVNSIETMSSF